ncbi:MAG: Tmc redox complex protein TmcD, partial [Desulfobacteraceae bacterium]|nr:Tmc redox complex protein TmcD [Desulfobacteraceae bacterium]
WTVAQNDQTWDIRSDMMISDLMYSRNGSTLAALVKNKGNWTLVVNNHMWNLNAQMVFGPVISSNGEVVAAVIEKKGKYFLSINNKIVNKGFDKMFLPKFSPDNQSIMQLTIDQGIYKREIIPLETLL